MMSFRDAHNTFIFPIYLSLTFSLWDKEKTPYVDIRAGYSFGSSEGIYFSPSIGIRFYDPNDRNSSMYLTLGYTMQSCESFSVNGEKINMLTFRLGFDF